MGVVALITRAARVVALAAALGLAAPAQAQLRVVAATTDVAAIAAAVGGDLITVDTIVPPAVDPEAFEPRPGDLEKIRNAQLLVRVGLGYDYWLDKLVRQTGDQRLMRGGEAYVDASVGIPLLEVSGQSVINEGGHAHGVANPHYWLDPENAKIVSAGIADALARLLPNERARIAANRERFVADLDRAIARWTAQLTPVAGAKLIAYHNSWPYFARRFRLDVIDFIEPKPGVAPSPAQLARLIAAGKKSGARAVVHEPYEPEDASRFVAQKLDIPFVLLATSVGSVPAAKDYFGLFDHNVGTLAKALGVPSQ
ncbi:MAG TPA: metal ABC transporter substrate-binding protein [Xanthobacteraceae bacterium]|nr:metal ABC transporter substrate-binding protein [Xanthobacteraceae bacterium]